MRAMVSDDRSSVLAIWAAAETHISMVKRTKLRMWNSCYRGLIGTALGRSSGMSDLYPTFPALTRWAKIVRPSGVERASNADLKIRTCTRIIYENALFAGVGHLDHGAVVTERRAAAEFGNRGENFCHGSALGRDLQALVVEEFAFGIFGFGYSIGD